MPRGGLAGPGCLAWLVVSGVEVWQLYGRPPRMALRHRPAAYFAGGASLPPTVRVGSWARLLDPASPLSNDRRRVGKLSRGQRQLVGLRSVLGADDSRFIVLDEPWSGPRPAWR